jgi:hypothetical protein
MYTVSNTYDHSTPVLFRAETEAEVNIFVESYKKSKRINAPYNRYWLDDNGNKVVDYGSYSEYLYIWEDKEFWN